MIRPSRYASMIRLVATAFQEVGQFQDDAFLDAVDLLEGTREVVEDQGETAGHVVDDKISAEARYPVQGAGFDPERIRETGQPVDHGALAGLSQRSPEIGEERLAPAVAEH